MERMQLVGGGGCGKGARDVRRRVWDRKPTHPGSWVLAMALCAATAAYSQNLTPRAYVITPTGSHAVIVSSSYSTGQVLIDPTVPIEDAKGTFQVSSVGYYQSFGLLGRSANITLIAPYARADLTATVDGSPAHVSRSGLGDAYARVAANLKGGPAMDVGEYLRWHENSLIGVSLTVNIPIGQYDPARLINLGTKRWGFKPEIGFSRRRGHWAVDCYLGGWFFTPNRVFYPGHSTRIERPVGAIEAHLGYYLRPRLWLSADANFWARDRSVVNGVEKQDQQRNSRVGATASVPLNQHNAVKVSYSQGAYVVVGGAYRTIGLGWQYSWIRQPR